MCQSDQFENGEAFRVTSADYSILSLYSDDFTCWTQQQNTPVCMCKPGFYDSVCATQLAQSCFVNITSPPLYEGCMDRPDTDYYMYSLGGFAPCFHYDFYDNHTFEFLIQCKVLTDLTNLATGFNYRDVISQSTAESKFELAASWAPELTVVVEVRDMKYLSHANRSEWTTTDADVMNGLKPMSMTLNFADIMATDQAGETKFVNGGRAFYEITVLGENTLSFMTRGFFDQAGYVQPAKQADSKKIVIAVFSTLGGLLLVGGLCYWCKRRQDEIERIKGNTRDSMVIKTHQD